MEQRTPLLAGLPHGALWAYRVETGCVSLVENEMLCVAPQPDGVWSWTHFPLSDQRSRAFLQRANDLPLAARELVLGSHDAPQVHFEGAWTFGILPDFEPAGSAKSVGFGRLAFLFDTTRLVTARRHALVTVDEIRRAMEAGRVFVDPLDAFRAFVQRYCDLAEDHVDELSRGLDSIEDSVLTERGDLSRINLGPTRRDLSRRHREVASLRTAFHRAGSRNVQVATHPIGPLLPGLVQRAEDVDREISALQDRARLVHEEIDTKITSATNRTLRALTIISTLLMPPTLIVGAFGMNLKGIVWEHSPIGFWLACGMCLVTIVAAYVVLIRLRVFG